MLISFETTTLTMSERASLLQILKLEAVEVSAGLANEALTSTSPITGSVSAESFLKEPETKKRGRKSNAEKAAEEAAKNPPVATQVETVASPASTIHDLFDEPKAPVEDQVPVTMDQIRDAAKAKVASSSLEDLSALFKTFKCERASDILNLPEEKKREFIKLATE